MARVDKFSAAPARTIKQAVKQITSWSFSRYQVYVLCPLKAKLKFLDKLQEPSADALERGSLIHKQAELYIKGLPCPVLAVPYPKLDKNGDLPATGVKYHKKGLLPPELSRFQAGFDFLAKRYKSKLMAMSVEDTWAFREDWSITAWNDWDGCKCRIKVDCSWEEEKEVLIIKDWKTGKFNADLHGEYLEALELYALGGLLFFPHIKEVRPALVYLDIGLTYPAQGAKPISYTRADIPQLKERWAKRVKPMLADTRFAPRPNSKCGWCAFGQKGWSKAGGDPKLAPCKF